MSTAGPRPRSSVLPAARAEAAAPADLAELVLDPAGYVDDRLYAALVGDRVERAEAEARQQGYADGLADGLAEARRRAEEAERQQARAAASALVALTSAADQVASALEAALAAVSGRIADLALDLAAAVVGRDLGLSETSARDAVARALSAAPPEAEVRLRLNPSDAALAAGLDLPPAVDVVPDAGLDPGDAVADLAPGWVDARLDAALSRARAALGGVE